MTDADKAVAQKILADMLGAKNQYFSIEYNEQEFYEGTRVLQRQPEYLELPFDQLLKQFPYVLNVST